MKLILTGHFAGRTVKLNGYQFDKGVLNFNGDVDKMGGLINYFASYNAFPAGSAELEAALKRDRENADGQGNVSNGSGAGDSGVSSDESGSEGEATGTGDAGTEAGGTGVLSPGAGTAKGRVEGDESGTSDPQMLKVIDALKALDPSVDDNWTDAGLPKVSVIAEASGFAGVTRKDIEAALPGWNREKAMDAI